MPFAVSAGTAGLIAAGVGAVGSVAGSMISAGAAKDAVSSNEKVAKVQLQREDALHNEEMGLLSPYFNNGVNAMNSLEPYTSDAQNQMSDAYANASRYLPGTYGEQITLPTFDYTQPTITNTAPTFDRSMPNQMTQAELEATPGYQFSLNQGLRAAQNSAAARGLGVSGAALAGAAKFATGLADNTYQNQFANSQQLFADRQTLNQLGQQDFANQQTMNQNQQQLFTDRQLGNQLNQNQFANQNTLYNNRRTQFADAATLANLKNSQMTNGYNMLLSRASLGENAAVQQGNQANTLSQQSTNTLQNLGNAQAAGATAQGAAGASLANGLGNSVTNYLGIQKYLSSGNGNGSGSGSGASTYSDMFGMGNGGAGLNTNTAGAYGGFTGGSSAGISGNFLNNNGYGYNYADAGAYNPYNY